MEGKSIISLMLILVFTASLLPVSMNAYSESRDTTGNESEQLDYYNSLSISDKANYSSDYAEDGEAPTPWSTGEIMLYSIIGIMAIVAAVKASIGD